MVTSRKVTFGAVFLAVCAAGTATVPVYADMGRVRREIDQSLKNLGLINDDRSLAVASNENVAVPSVADGRLTLSSSDSVPTSDLTDQTTLYYLPHTGRRLAVYDGSDWSHLGIGSSGLSITNSGLSVDTNYDVFYDKTSSSLELIAWTNNTTRATALTRQDGVLVETGDTDSRYLGTIRTVDDGGTAKFTDATQQRFVWNAANRVRTSNVLQDSTTSWSVSSTSWVHANGGADGHRFEFVLGREAWVETEVNGAFGADTDTGARVGIGLDGTYPVASGHMAGFIPRSATNQNAVEAQGRYAGAPGVGYHYLDSIERLRETGPRNRFGVIDSSPTHYFLVTAER